MLQALRQTHSGQRARRRLQRLGPWQSANEQRHGHVFHSAELRQQMMELINKTQVQVAQTTLLGARQARQVLPHEPDLTAGRRIEPAEQVQQSALARTRSADDGQGLPGTDLQIHALQHLHVQRAFHKPFGQALGLQHRLCPGAIVGRLIIHNARPAPG